MPKMTSPQGEVLDIPAESAHALRALGWTQAPEPATETKTAPKTRKARTTKE